jgi:hypothetical protein
MYRHNEYVKQKREEKEEARGVKQRGKERTINTVGV